MLPLIRCIVRDINATGTELREMAEAGAAKTPGFKKSFAEIAELIQELESLGCFYKDWAFSIGIVEFPAIIDGEEVVLSWRGDEETVRHYCRPQSGCHRRRPIPLRDAEWV